LWYFRAGSGAGERLAAWGNDKLECVIAGKSPAHTMPLFAYHEYLATEDGAEITTEGGYTLAVERAEG